MENGIEKKTVKMKKRERALNCWYDVHLAQYLNEGKCLFCAYPRKKSKICFDTKNVHFNVFHEKCKKDVNFFFKQMKVSLFSDDLQK